MVSSDILTLGPHEVGTLEAIQVKILITVRNVTNFKGTKKNPENVKLELSSENDLFFHYTAILDEESFQSF